MAISILLYLAAMLLQVLYLKKNYKNGVGEFWTLFYYRFVNKNKHIFSIDIEMRNRLAFFFHVTSHDELDIKIEMLFIRVYITIYFY